MIGSDKIVPSSKLIDEYLLVSTIGIELNHNQGFTESFISYQR